MRVALLTREFPPDVYGGAGVHVDFLVRELRRLIDESKRRIEKVRQPPLAQAIDPVAAGPRVVQPQPLDVHDLDDRLSVFGSEMRELLLRV